MSGSSSKKRAAWPESSSDSQFMPVARKRSRSLPKKKRAAIGSQPPLSTKKRAAIGSQPPLSTKKRATGSPSGTSNLHQHKDKLGDDKYTCRQAGHDCRTLSYGKTPTRLLSQQGVDLEWELTDRGRMYTKKANPSIEMFTPFLRRYCRRRIKDYFGNDMSRYYDYTTPRCTAIEDDGSFCMGVPTSTLSQDKGKCPTHGQYRIYNRDRDHPLKGHHTKIGVDQLRAAQNLFSFAKM